MEAFFFQALVCPGTNPVSWTMSRFLTRTGPHYEASQSDLIGPYCDSYCDQGNHFFYGCREKKTEICFPHSRLGRPSIRPDVFTVEHDAIRINLKSEQLHGTTTRDSDKRQYALRAMH